MKSVPLSTTHGFTIDGETSRDLDDAIWAVARPGGGYRVTVCIADVAEVVRPGGQLDESAYHRVETRYLRVGNRPMLPRELSEGSLSLFTGRRRRVLALTVDLEKDGTPGDPAIAEAVLVSAAQLDHDTTDRILQGQAHPLREQLLLCQAVARVLFVRRQTGGACAVYDPVKKVYADEDGVIRPLRGSAHAQLIVQEFMILANERVASWMARSGRSLVFRNHQARVVAPGREEILRQLGEASLRPDLMPALQERMALWMERAVYSPVLLGHYALNLPAYAHFTSPIRRYADLVNHRLVKAAIRGEAPPYDREALETISGAINAWKLEQAGASQEHFKQKAIEERRQVLGQASAHGFDSLDSAAFSRVLEQAAKDDNLTPELAAAVVGRDLAPLDLFHVLFRGGLQWLEVRQALLEKLQPTPHVATMVLEIARQKDDAELLQEAVPTRGGFLGRLTVGYQGQVLTRSEPSQAQSKKAALALEALGWLEGWVDGSLVSPGEIVPLGSHVGPAAGATGVGEDHVAALNLWCQEHKIKDPAYDYTKEGPDHEPTFKAKVIIFYGDHQMEAVGEATARKQDAKQSAAGLLRMELPQ